MNKYQVSVMGFFKLFYYIYLVACSFDFFLSKLMQTFTIFKMLSALLVSCILFCFVSGFKSYLFYFLILKNIFDTKYRIYRLNSFVYYGQYNGFMAIVQTFQNVTHCVHNSTK